ncbi:MAG: STAS/SEC14 domain-containing protein [Anaerolineae bacterium]|nr:STAS/SEC14 domain-containing protein [Anaerolineae bacterium]MCO5190290.1 STAS/SEC14 domain-containing protein [Anaerolineae bacterium]MCO5192283.1 STAS/SEC14 domain-containing protein [Anaerolineae bacterium]MCO5204165.1 STAS/SEC14 domain-containing protein [Anaerolineae bacterium]
MIELQHSADSNIIIVTAKSKVTGDDYENVLIPAIQSTLEQYDKLRFLYVLGEEYDGFDRHALWDDSKVGMKELTHFEKIGVVTDETWIRGAVKAFGFLIPGDVKLFDNDQLAEAEAWIAA